MKKRTTYAIGFVIMIILNGVLIFLMLRGPILPPPPPSGPAKGGDLQGKISKELGLNFEQQETYAALAKEHRFAMDQLEKDQKEVIKSYFNSLIEDEGNTAIMLEKIEQYESDKITLTYQHFEQLKALCSEDQKTQFKLIMKDIIAVLVGPEINNRPPPPQGR